MTVGVLLITHEGIGSAMLSVATRLLRQLPLKTEAFEVPFDFLMDTANHLRDFRDVSAVVAQDQGTVDHRHDYDRQADGPDEELLGVSRGDLGIGGTGSGLLRRCNVRDVGVRCGHAAHSR